jgi:hypothetical protein
MVNVVGLGGRGRRLVRVRIRARILVRITRSVCEVIFGVWRGEGEYWGFWGGHSETLLTSVVDGGVLRRCGTWEDVYMKRKSI